MCLCGPVLSEPAGACASVYCTSPESFVRCKPTKGLYSALVLAPQDFAPSAYVLVRPFEQMSSCTRICTHVRYELTRYLCFCAGVCSLALVREPVCLYGASPRLFFAVFLCARVAERSIHVKPVHLRVLCEHPQSRTIYSVLFMY